MPCSMRPTPPRGQKGLRAAGGRSLNTVQNYRQIADYEGDPPSLEDTTEALRLAEAFVAEIRALFFPD